MTNYRRYTRGLHMVMFGPRAYRGRVVEPAFPDQDDDRAHWGIVLPYRPSEIQVAAMLLAGTRNELGTESRIEAILADDEALADTAGGVFVWMQWTGPALDEDGFYRWPAEWTLRGAGPVVSSDPYIDDAERRGDAARLIGALWETVAERLDRGDDDD
jgi:hypothetical protein